MTSLQASMRSKARLIEEPGANEIQEGQEATIVKENIQCIV